MWAVSLTQNMLGHLTAAVLERYLIGEDFLNLLSPDTILILKWENGKEF